MLRFHHFRSRFPEVIIWESLRQYCRLKASLAVIHSRVHQHYKMLLHLDKPTKCALHGLIRLHWANAGD